MIPEASEELAEPVVWAMLASKMEALPQIFSNDLKSATDITASGMAVLMVSPTRKPR